MLINVSKKIEVVANLAIILVACLLAIVLVKNHLFSGSSGQPASNQQSDNQPVNGRHLSGLDIDWKQSRQTLILAISASCHFCTESAPFYKKLGQGGGTRIVAVLPQPIEDGREYLKRLGVSVDDVKQLGLDEMGIRGTPTLLLVDNSGVLKDSWIGRLSPEQEMSVLNALRAQ